MTGPGLGHVGRLGRVGRLRRVGRWWRRRSLVQARMLLTVVAVAALLGGAWLGALVAPPGPGGAAASDRLDVDETRFGPIVVVLPEDLGPWVPVPASRMEEVRVAAAGGGLTLDGAWGAVAPDDIVLTVMTAPVGAHGGVRSVTGPFDRGRLDPAWPGSAPHRAGLHVVDGVREGVLAVEAPDGHLVVVSFSGPTAVLDATITADTLRTVRLPR